MPDPTCHVPVLLDEILSSGSVQSGQVWVDGTAGGGGHSSALLERIGPTGMLLAIDRDPVAILRLKATLPQRNLEFRQDSYESIPELLLSLSWGLANGILLDLGLSSDQLADRERGFSFLADGPLDMRFDPTLDQPVSQWLDWASEHDIADVIYRYGEERFSRRIARRIVETRKQQPIRTTSQLRELVARCIPGSRHNRIDPATRTFQALRIHINDELGSLERAIKRLPDCLCEGGVLMIVSFHSLEDRIVKYAFRDDPRLEVVTRKPLIASQAEVNANSRSRSAKLRVARRVDAQAE